MKRALTSILFLISVGQVQSQTLTLHELLETSQKNYPSIKFRLADKNSASRDVTAAYADYIPRLSAQHQYTYGTSNSVAGSFYPNPTVISPSGGIRDDNTSPATWGTFTSALLEWNIFNFGKVSGNVSAAKANLENSEAAYTNELFQHQVRVTDSYLLTLIADKMLTIQESNLERALQFKQIVDAGVRSGMRAGVDSALANVEYLKARMKLLDAQKNQNTQKLLLRELTGTIDTELSSVDSMHFYTEIPRGIDAASSERELHPLLHFYQTRRIASEEKSIVIKRSFLPSITLVGSVWARGSGVHNDDDSFHTDFSSGTKYQVNNYLIGIATRWVISDYIPIRQRYKSEHYRVIRDQELYNEQDLKIQRQVKTSTIEFEVAIEQARTAPIQLAAAQQAFKQANARYKAGLTDLPTLLQSMTSLTQAEADVAIAYGNVWRSLLAIAAAKGDFSIFLNAAETN